MTRIPTAEAPDLTNPAHWEGVAIFNPIKVGGTSDETARCIFQEPFGDFIRDHSAFRPVDVGLVVRHLEVMLIAPTAKTFPREFMPLGSIAMTSQSAVRTKNHAPFFGEHTEHLVVPSTFVWTQQPPIPDKTTVSFWGCIRIEDYAACLPEKTEPSPDRIQVSTYLLLGRWASQGTPRSPTVLYERNLTNMYIPKTAYDSWMRRYGEPQDAPSV